MKMEWRPIEYAPRDGRNLLLWINDRIHIGNFNVGRQFWCREEFPYVSAPATDWLPMPLGPDELTEDEELDNAFYEALAKDD